MEIVELSLSEAGVLSPLYNRLVKGVPFCFGVGEDEFTTGLLWNSDDFAHHRCLESQHLIACRGKEEVGFTHIAVECKEGVRRGVIRFLGFSPDDRATGQALLREAERVLWDLGITEILAFPRIYGYRFHQKASGHVSGMHPHVIGLLGRSGYSIAATAWSQRCESLLFDMRDYEIAAPEPLRSDLSVDISIEDGEGQLPKAILRLLSEKEEIGKSETWPVGRWVSAPAARELFTISIRISREWRGSGLGSYLMRRGLEEMRQLGYRRAALETNMANYPAMSLFASIGFTPVGTAYGFAKNPGAA